MIPNKFRFQIEVWGNVKFENELGEMDIKPERIKTIFAEIIPQTGSMGKRQGVETILTNVTQKIVSRYNAGKDIKQDMWFKYGEHKFDIRFILNPYFRNKTLEFFCEEVTG